MLLLLACKPPPAESDTDETSGPTAIVLTVAGDYTAAAVAEVSLDTRAVRDTLAPTTTDPGVQTFDLDGPVLAVLERFGTDVVRLYDAAGPIDWSSPIAEFSTGERSNPLSVASCGGALVVARYGATSLGVYARDGASLGEIDLSAWADADGLPEPDSLVAIGDRLYVAIQRLDETRVPWQPALDGVIGVIDCASRQVVDTIPVGPDPTIAPFPADPTKLLLRTGVYYTPDNELSLDGGVAVLDPATKTITPWWLEADAGMNLTSAVGTAGGMVVLSQDPEFRYAVHCLDGTSRIDGPSTESFLFSADAAPDGTVWISARPSWEFVDPPVGLEIWDPIACTRAGEPVRTLLPPYGVAFVGG